MSLEAKFTPGGGVIIREIEIHATTCPECMCDTLHQADTEGETCINALCPKNRELGWGPS